MWLQLGSTAKTLQDPVAMPWHLQWRRRCADEFKDGDACWGVYVDTDTSCLCKWKALW